MSNTQDRAVIVGGLRTPFAKSFGELMELGQLILRQRLRGKEIQRARRRVVQNAMQDGRVVAERLSRRGGRDDDRVSTRERVLNRFRLMEVEAVDASRAQRLLQPGIKRLGKRFENRGRRRQPLDRCDMGVIVAGPCRGLVRRKHP